MFEIRLLSIMLIFPHFDQPVEGYFVVQNKRWQEGMKVRANELLSAIVYFKVDYF